MISKILSLQQVKRGSRRQGRLTLHPVSAFWQAVQHSSLLKGPNALQVKCADYSSAPIPLPPSFKDSTKEWIKEWPSKEEAERDPDEPYHSTLNPKDNNNNIFPSEYMRPGTARSNGTETLLMRRKRLLMMCRKRGILEMDLILSTWVHPRLEALSELELDELDRLLCEHSDWDLFYWTTGAKRVPARVAALSIWPSLSAHAKNEEGRRGMRMPDL